VFGWIRSWGRSVEELSNLFMNVEELSKLFMDRTNHRDRSEKGDAARKGVSFKAVGNRFYGVNVD
jgi:hypothetical protein